MTLYGIDVSHHQGTPNFGAVKAAGNSFVFIKATEGVGYTDPAFSATRAAARAVGLTVGLYHFASAGNPTSEADYFCAVVGSLKTGDLVVLDWETTAPNPPGWCKAWLDRVASTLGVKPLIYLNQSTRDGFDWSPVVAGNYGLWLAAYDNNPTTVPGSGRWPNVAFKQYTSSGTVPGVAGQVDRNTFFGDATALGKYGKQAPTPPPAPEPAQPPAPKPAPVPTPLPGDIVTPADIDAIATAVAAKVRADQFTITEGPAKGTKIAGQTALRDILAAVTAIRAKLGA